MSGASIPLGAFAAFGLCYAGMAALSLAMDRHYEQVTACPSVPRNRRIVLRVLGTLLLALALWVCMSASGASVGAVAWLGWLTVGAMGVAWLLPYAPRFAVSAAAVSAVSSIIALTTIGWGGGHGG